MTLIKRIFTDRAPLAQKKENAPEGSAKIGPKRSVIGQDRIEKKRAGRNGPLEGHQPRR
jgi:hypothetical protein